MSDGSRLHSSEQTHAQPQPMGRELASGCVLHGQYQASRRGRLVRWATALVVLGLLAGLPEPGLRRLSDRLRPVATRDARPSPAGLTVPLAFEENRGQAGAQVRFLSRVPGGTAFFTPSGITLVARDQATRSPAGPSAPSSDSPQPADPPPVLEQQFLGVARPAQIVAGSPLPGQSNYFLGSDPAQWRLGVPTYASIAYVDLYPGITVRYAGRAGNIEGTYELAATADPGTIRWRYAGAGVVTVDPNGSLRVEAGAALAIVEQRPMAWQDVDGTQVDVPVRYQLAADGSVGFAVACYDPARPLIIDPVLTYSTYLGGTGLDDGMAIAVDGQGSMYVAGSTQSNDFPAVEEGNPGVGRGRDDAFVTKLSPDGSRVLFTAYLGGSNADTAWSLAVDSEGSAYVTGHTYSTDFPLAHPLQPRLRGTTDAFVTKFDPSGGSLVYSTYLGGGDDEEAHSIAVDLAGSAFVSGTTWSADFPLAQPLQPAFGGHSDVFVTQLNAQGTGLVYSTYLGGSAADSGLGAALDAQGDLCVSGFTISPDFPLVHPAQNRYAGGTDAFVAKIAERGASLLYSTYLGGTSIDSGDAIAVDAAGSAYVTGVTESRDFPVAHAYQAEPGGQVGRHDGFLSKLTASGTLAYSTYYGGSSDDDPAGVAVDPEGDAYVLGNTTSPDLRAIDAPQPAYRGAGDVFLVRFNSTGSQALFANYLGGSSRDVSHGIAVDGAGNVYVVGETVSRDFPIVGVVPQDTPAGDWDVFITRLNSVCTMAFQDVTPADPFYSYVLFLACRQIVTGYADGTYRPSAYVTRGQLVKAVSNAADYTDPIPPDRRTFADVPPSNPFWLYAERAALHGLIAGYACGSPGEPCDAQGRPYFRPSANVTRGQLAKITAAAPAPGPVPAVQTFEDVPPGNPFYSWVEQLAARHAISGYDCGATPAGPCVPPQDRPYFLPAANVTRAQMAKVLTGWFFPSGSLPNSLAGTQVSAAPVGLGNAALVR